jgi:hypothetical protein
MEFFRQRIGFFDLKKRISFELLFFPLPAIFLGPFHPFEDFMQTFLLSVLALRFAFQYFHEAIDVPAVADRFAGDNLIILIGGDGTHRRQDGSWRFGLEVVRGRGGYGLGSSCILPGRSY